MKNNEKNNNMFIYLRDPLGQPGILLLLDPHYPPEALVPSIHDRGEHLCWHYFNQGFLC